MTATPSPAIPQDEQTRCKLRSDLEAVLGLPAERCDLEPEFRGEYVYDDVVVERWIWMSEPGSRVTSLLYRPKDPQGPMPAMIITNGHGGSKSALAYRYTGPLYAKLGMACLMIDTIGEEERHIEGRKGTRAHDKDEADTRAAAAGRLIFGKMLLDHMRSIDFLITRPDIDADRIGVAGNSLGGVLAKWLAALDLRLKAAIVSGSGIGDYDCTHGKLCSRVPNQGRENICDMNSFMSLAAPHCAILVMNGDADSICDKDGDGAIWQQTREQMAEIARTYEQLGAPGNAQVWFQPGGGHRAYHHHPDALVWLHRHVGTPGWSLEQIQALPTITLGEWAEKYGIKWPGGYDYYWTELHHRGAICAALGVQPAPLDEVACLDAGEIGDPQYTLAGWLDRIEQT